jgi:hypothetical protein
VKRRRIVKRTMMTLIRLRVLDLWVRGSRWPSTTSHANIRRRDELVQMTWVYLAMTMKAIESLGDEISIRVSSQKEDKSYFNSLYHLVLVLAYSIHPSGSTPNHGFGPSPRRDRTQT